MVFDFPGALLGALIAAYFADKLGRRLSFLVMLISTLTVGTMISSAKYFIAYLIFRLMMGMTLTGGESSYLPHIFVVISAPLL